MGLRQRLRRATRDQHQALEALPLFEAMAQGSLPRSAYVAWLRVMAVVVDATERELDACGHAALRRLWTPQMRKRSLLQADLRAFEDVSVSTTPATEPLLALVELVRGWSLEDPARLIGVLYVLEGSTLGGRTLRTRLAERYAREGEGVAYISSYGPRTGSMWASLCRELDALELSDDVAARVVDAAQRFFSQLGEVMRTLSGTHARAARGDG